MTREIAKKLLPFIQAFAEGKDIEYSFDGEQWESTNTPSWACNLMYRIKPGPKYRPFKTKEECWDEIHKHSDFGWLIRIDTGIFANINAISSKEIVFDNDFECVYTFEYAFKYYKFTDGTPFGIKDENNIE